MPIKFLQGGGLSSQLTSLSSPESCAIFTVILRANGDAFIAHKIHRIPVSRQPCSKLPGTSHRYAERNLGGAGGCGSQAGMEAAASERRPFLSHCSPLSLPFPEPLGCESCGINGCCHIVLQHSVIELYSFMLRSIPWVLWLGKWGV